MRSYDQPTKDLTKILISAPRVFAAVYDSASPATYDGLNIIDISVPPTGSNWIDVGVIEGVTMTTTKNIAHKELGRPKTRRKSVEISRQSKLDFTLSELIPESISLLMGLQSKNILTGTETTVSTATSRTSIVVASATGLTAGKRVCTNVASLGLIDSVNRAIISVVNGTTITLAGTGFPVIPAVSDKIKPYASIEMVDLMDVIAERSLLMFFDWQEESYQRQVAVWFPRMATVEPFNPDLKGAENYADAKVSLESLATDQLLTDGTTKTVHGKLYFFD